MLRKVFYWGPLVALGIIKMISLCSINCISMWWPPMSSLWGFLHLSVFLTWNGLVLYHFFSSIAIGPGFIPSGWKPDEEFLIAAGFDPEQVKEIMSANPPENGRKTVKFVDEKGDAEEPTHSVLPYDEWCRSLLQYCDACKCYKAPRSHHCRKCRRCVMKMDHHCPWINNCVGHMNHAHFIWFLVSAVIGCLHAFVVLVICIFRALNVSWYVHYGPRGLPLVHMSVGGFVCCLFSAGLAIGVVIAVGMLLYFQMKMVLTNKTGIEQWIVEKAQWRREPGEAPFKFPYDLGWRQNLAQVFTWNSEPRSCGFLWPVVVGCDQFTLTMEQISQKRAKRERTKTYNIVEAYSGRWLPISKGPKVCFNPPYTDEPRIRLEIGDEVVVTRWKQHWLYGEKVKSAGRVLEVDAKNRKRGWFPRRCAIPILDCSSAGKKSQ